MPRAVRSVPFQSVLGPLANPYESDRFEPGALASPYEYDLLEPDALASSPGGSSGPF